MLYLLYSFSLCMYRDALRIACVKISRLSLDNKDNVGCRSILCLRNSRESETVQINISTIDELVYISGLTFLARPDMFAFWKTRYFN